MKIDRHNLLILKALQENGRISNLHLSEAIGLSESACLARVKKLTSERYVRRFFAEPNLEKVRHAEFYVNVALKRQDARTSTGFRQAIDALPQVVSCVKVSGEFDYILHFVCPDAADFNRVSEQLLADENAAISRMTSQLVIENTKPFSGYPLEMLFADD
ncbi:Lrp/AsnC family transcriptional regulator [Biformimicrobium ophioploci]|uniref:Lrp/AsnC family transcriptional regulator n=1 Tax=Biformimicrobium ophioploci TaxID=3036711 RepID=A0ABQ6LYP3_9GAMM|nr:Lrp/AsnC family transcriptional regulator [Microbulbifer sp. NKW57]GMG87201.1 Lrp/AsnC family transcriptional regulator [Microbulbifer sp. NKW57]